MRVISIIVALLAGCSAPSQGLLLTAERASATANGTDAVLITATGSTDFIDFTASGGVLSTTRVKGDGATTQLTSSTAGSITVTASVAKGPSASTTVTFTAPTTGPRLRFQTSPGNTTAQNLLRPVPVVVVEDPAGVVTSSSAPVTVAITAGSCAAALDASSLMTVSAVQGVASFYGLKSSTTATGCTLTATSSGLQSAVSTAFDLQ
ncbi:MAG: hypothetical protein Q8L48_38745 [Archangium sp.]|nr:hypothetical protein [Archangium sp.]